jgi:hypothetical protein
VTRAAVHRRRKNGPALAQGGNLYFPQRDGSPAVIVPGGQVVPKEMLSRLEQPLRCWVEEARA